MFSAKSYLFRMARIRMAFNACGFLTYCDEVLVTLGHRISAINDYARVNDPPSECPSADSCSGSGNDSPRTIRDTRDSAEDSDDETRQPPNAVMPVQVKKLIKLLLQEIQTQVHQQQYLNMKTHVMILSLLKKMFRELYLSEWREMLLKVKHRKKSWKDSCQQLC